MVGCAGIMRRKNQAKRHGRRLTGTERVDFVTCRICGDRRRVISGRHLSKHDTERLTYMEEYDLSPDQLIAKAFRMIQTPGLAINHMTKGSGSLRLRKSIDGAGVFLP